MRVSLRAWDRLLWVALVRLWPEWRQALMLVKPETVDLVLDKDSPETREVQPPDKDIIVEIPRVGGLHHRCERRAA